MGDAIPPGTRLWTQSRTLIASSARPSSVN